MPLPAEGPATRSGVKPLLGVAPDDDTQNADIDLRVEAVNVYVRTLSVCDRVDADPAPADWAGQDDIVLGSNMLAARLVRRKDSPDGVAAATSADVVFVARNDPDVALLLRLGPYADPVAT